MPKPEAQSTRPRHLPDDGTKVRVVHAEEWSQEHVNDQPQTERQTGADFQDGPWLIQRRNRRGQWLSLGTIDGRPAENDLRTEYGVGSYRCTPLDQMGQPIGKLVESHILADANADEEDDKVDFEQPQYQQQSFGGTGPTDPLTLFINMQQNQAMMAAQAARDQQAREEARQDREDARRQDREDREEARRQAAEDKEEARQAALAVAETQRRYDLEAAKLAAEAAAADREERRLDREAAARAEAAAKEQDRADREEARHEKEKTDERQRNDERAARDEAERQRRAEADDKAAQRAHEMQIRMMELQADRQNVVIPPPVDPMNNPVFSMLFQHILDSKKPDVPVGPPAPTLLEQINGLDKIRVALEPFGPQAPEAPPEKDFMDKIGDNLPAIAGMVSALRGVPAAPGGGNPVAGLLSNLPLAGQLIADAMDQDPEIATKLGDAVNAELEKREAAKKK